MTPKWQKLARLAQEICTLWFQFFGAVFDSKGYPFKNILLFAHLKSITAKLAIIPLLFGLDQQSIFVMLFW